MVRYRILPSLILVLLLSINSDSHAQDIETMLNTISYVFTTKQEKYYDEAEDFLMNVNKDSIASNVNLEMQYHLDLSLLHEIKYDNYEKAIEEQEFVYNKLAPYKFLEEYSSLYQSFIMGYAYHLMNFGILDKAEGVLNKIIIDNIFDEYSVHYYNTFNLLSRIYENKLDTTLAKECHNKCQEFLVKRYIKDNPQYSFYLDNYKTFKYTLSSLERTRKTNTESYINNLCSLGTLLRKIDYGEYWESFLLFQNALDYSQKYKLNHCNGLSECYVNLQRIYIEYLPEPMKSEMIERLIPMELEYYAQVIDPSDIYYSISTTFAVNKQPENAIKYGLMALESANNEVDNHKSLMKVYQGLIYSYLDLSTDSANSTAFEYLNKLESIVTEQDIDYYDWCLEEKGIILRYLEKIGESKAVINTNLKYFEKKYGKLSDQYVSSLNQLSMAFSEDDPKRLFYLKEAKGLISSGKIKDSIVRGVSINLARYYISKKKYNEARIELGIAEDIERASGQLTPLTEELIIKCKQ